MKRSFILSLALMLASLTTWAQSFFEKFENYDDVEYVYVSKSLIGLVDNVESSGVKLKGISEKIDNVIIIDMDKYVVVKGAPKNSENLQPASVSYRDYTLRPDFNRCFRYRLPLRIKQKIQTWYGLRTGKGYQ